MPKCLLWVGLLLSTAVLVRAVIIQEYPTQIEGNPEIIPVDLLSLGSYDFVCGQFKGQMSFEDEHYPANKNAVWDGYQMFVAGYDGSGRILGKVHTTFPTNNTFSTCNSMAYAKTFNESHIWILGTFAGPKISFSKSSKCTVMRNGTWVLNTECSLTGSKDIEDPTQYVETAFIALMDKKSLKVKTVRKLFEPTPGSNLITKGVKLNAVKVNKYMAGVIHFKGCLYRNDSVIGNLESDIRNISICSQPPKSEEHKDNEELRFMPLFFTFNPSSQGEDPVYINITANYMFPATSPSVIHDFSVVSLNKGQDVMFFVGNEDIPIANSNDIANVGFVWTYMKDTNNHRLGLMWKSRIESSNAPSLVIRKSLADNRGLSMIVAGDHCGKWLKYSNTSQHNLEKLTSISPCSGFVCRYETANYTEFNAAYCSTLQAESVTITSMSLRDTEATVKNSSSGWVSGYYKGQYLLLQDAHGARAGQSLNTLYNFHGSFGVVSGRWQVNLLTGRPEYKDQKVLAASLNRNPSIQRLMSVNTYNLPNGTQRMYLADVARLPAPSVNIETGDEFSSILNITRKKNKSIGNGKNEWDWLTVLVLFGSLLAVFLLILGIYLYKKRKIPIQPTSTLHDYARLALQDSKPDD